MPSSYDDLEGYKWEEVDLRSAADLWLHFLSHLDSYSGHSWSTIMVKYSIESLFHFIVTLRVEKITSVDFKNQ